MQAEDECFKQIRGFLKNRKLIVASNRGPFEFFQTKEGTLTKKRGGGGLISAFLALSDIPNLVWISAARTESDQEIGEKGHKLADGKLKLNVKFTVLDNEIKSPYYDVVSNQLFWYTQHCLWNVPYTPFIDKNIYNAWYNGYVPANEQFAKVIATEANSQKQALILVQDYHLYLCPKNLRPLLKNSVVLHFTHIPWPSPDIWEVLPTFVVSETIEGLLNADIVAFHCQNYAHNFMETVTRYLPAQVDLVNQEISWLGRKVSVAAFPISISATQLQELAKSTEVQAYEKDLLSRNEGKIILRVDRAELSKNIVRGFQAFELLLKRNPALKRKVTFLALLYPTRGGLKDYDLYLNTIKKISQEINAKFGTPDWKPVKLRVADNYLQSLASYKLYDVLLVNSVFDGMNLVSKEGPLLNCRDGVLVLSKNCGAMNELGRFCSVINPFDIEQTATSLEQALLLSRRERKAKAQFLKQIITKNNSLKWLYHQIKAVDKISC